MNVFFKRSKKPTCGASVGGGGGGGAVVGVTDDGDDSASLFTITGGC